MRVSDNTSKSSVEEALRRTRGKMEKLQIQNATQKKLINPSDDPAANNKIMDIRTQTTVNAQFEQNAALAKNKLQAVDTALGEIYDIFVRAKEIAINQSSDASASPESRTGVAQEVASLYKQLIAVANRRQGTQYLFGGFKTLNAPYSADGQYKGDAGEMPVEVQKDVFISSNVPGPTIFEVKKFKAMDAARSPAGIEATTMPGDQNTQSIPVIEQQKPVPSGTINVFHELDSLRVGLLTNDTLTIRDTLDQLDEIIKNTVTIRAKISARVSGIDNSIGATQKTDLQNAELSTQLEDADYAELWAGLAKEETALRSSLHAAQKLIQPTLLEFLR